MDLTLIRFSSQKNDTLGLLMDSSNGVSKFLCFTLEDEFRTNKIYGETRIPDGKYKIKLRTKGGFHERYTNKYGSEFHKGMLHLQDVPNFEHVLIHTGNDDDDTAGCILVGNQTRENVTNDGFIGDSVSAYKRIYPAIRDAILQGSAVFIKIINLDTI